MSTLTSSPFSLMLGNLVVVKVLAINSKGSGKYSIPNTVGALVESIPQAPKNPPFSAANTTQF